MKISSNFLHVVHFNKRFARFLITGGINTILGYGIFALFNFFLVDKFIYGYLYALILSNIVSISTNYINYKFFVFRTKGNYLLEYFRFYIVYGLSILINLIVMPVLVEVGQLNSYLAGLLLIPLSIIISFLGHNKYSFRESK